ncbi:MAG: hypothetical protein Q8R36_03880 [bacterium]|nr:hypothetical protein [bacterium]
MRFGNFESMGLKPLGEGDEKRVFVNPENKRKIISETKEEVEKDTPRQLRGRYYLTKIAHLLLPKNIPDIYQVRESVDGKQTIDAERISHTQGHALLQEKRQSGGDEESAGKQITEEMGAEIGKLDLELERIGLSFSIDGNIGNYTKDEKGDVYYLETFKPWQVDPVNLKELEVLFNEEELREAIGGISDQEVKEKCTQHLERLLVLLEEEKQEIQEHHEARLIDCRPLIAELEATISPFMGKEIFATLHAIKTGEEALNNRERESAKQALISILSQLKTLEEKTNITAGEYDELYEKYQILCHAVGIINRGAVDHNR